MQFQVPQFIETEDKIIGPLTLKQFLYIAAAGGFSFIAFYLLQTWLWLIFTFLIGTIAVSLAFIRVNGLPLPKIAVSALLFYWKPKLFLWKKTEKFQSAEFKLPAMYNEKQSSLKNLWQQLITSKNPLPQREKSLKPSIWEKTRGTRESLEIIRKITGEREMTKRIDYR